LTRVGPALLTLCLATTWIACGDAGSVGDTDVESVDADGGLLDTLGADADTATPDTLGEDTRVPDVTPVDTTVSDAADADSPDATEEDSGSADTTTLDIEPSDTASADTSPADTADTSPADTADTSPTDTADATPTDTADTTPTDTAVTDTSLPDTEIPDVGPTDTTVADTSLVDTEIPDADPTDTTVADTPIADTASQDTEPTDVSEPVPEPVPRAWRFSSFGDGSLQGPLATIEGLRRIGDDLWIMGFGNRLWTYRDGRFLPLEATQYHLNNDACGSGPDDLWASGRLGGVAHWDGAAWGPVRATDNSPVTLHCDGPRVTAIPVGGDVSWHFNGSGWSSISTSSNNPTDVAGAWDDLWGVEGGDLWRFDGTSWSFGTSADGHLRAIEELDDGTLCAVGNDSTVICAGPGETWESLAGPPGDLELVALAGGGVDDLWVATEDARVLRWDGASWSAPENVFASALVSIDGAVYRGDVGGSVFVTEGTGWRNLSRTRGELLSQSASGALYRSGGRAGLDRFDGSGWTAMAQPFEWDKVGAVLAIDDDDLWLAGWTSAPVDDLSVVQRWDGATWHAYSLPTPRATYDVIDGLWARSSAEVYAWTEQGDVLRWDGAAWQSLNHLVTVQPRFVSGMGDAVWVGGRAGGGASSSFAIDLLAGSAPWTSVPSDIAYPERMDVAGDVGWLITEQGRVWKLAAGEWTEDIALSPAGSAAMLVATDSDVWVSTNEQRRWDGDAWVDPGPGFSLNAIAGEGDDLHGAHVQGGHMRWNGTAWSQAAEATPSVVRGEVTAAAAGEDGVVYTAGFYGVLRDDGASAVFEPAERLDHVGHLFTLGAEAAWALGSSDENGASVPTMWERSGGSWRRILGPPTGSISYPFVSGQAVAGEVWVSNARPVNNFWRYKDEQWTQIILGEPDTWFQLAPMDGGRIMALAHERNVTPEECQLWHHDGVDWSYVATVPNTIKCDGATSVWAAATTNVWLLDSTGDLARWDGSGWTTQPTGNYGGRLAGPYEDDLWLLGASQLRKWDPTAAGWMNVNFAAGKAPTAIAGRPYGDLVFAGRGFTAAYVPE